jgi:putative transposase
MACFQSFGYLLPMSSKGWHSRGYLPHLDTGDVVQFVTFRLADSLPKEAVERLRFLAHAEARRDEMLAWTVMPNHVHVLFKLLAPHGLGAVVGSWKRFTARAANRRLGRSGAFWQDDYWDRFVRHDAHYAAAVAYIDQNPVKAGLVAAPEDWPWGSARFQH